MDAECASAVLQCFLDVDNFHQLLTTSLSSQNVVNFDSSTAQDDAVLIYDKLALHFIYMFSHFVPAQYCDEYVSVCLSVCSLA